MNQYFNEHFKRVVTQLSTVYAGNSPGFTDKLASYRSFLNQFRIVDHENQDPPLETNSERRSNQLVALIDFGITILRGTADAPNPEDLSSLISEIQPAEVKIVLDIFNKFIPQNEKVTWKNLTPFQKKSK